MAKRENRTMSELVRESFRRYQREEEDRRLAGDLIRQQRLLELKRAVAEFREEATEAGISKLNKRQIDAAIEAYRTDKRQKKTKQPIK